MRKMADPIVRTQALSMYRAGFTDQEVGHALEVSLQQLRNERNKDWEWNQQVKEAKRTSFRPVREKLFELAEEADAMGINEGSHKALNLLTKYMTRVEDRDHEHEIVKEKAKHQAAVEALRPASLSLATPEAGAAFAAELLAGEDLPTDDEDEDG